MEPYARASIGLTAIALSAWLLAGCEGDGTVGADSVSAQPPVDSNIAKVTAMQPAHNRRAAEVQEATRDLGLVDPAQEVRLDVASELHGELSIEQFGFALQDENPAVRQEAVDALLGAPEAVVLSRLAQLRYAMTDPDEAVRESVVAGLGGSSDPRVIAILLAARGDESPIVREEAREALLAYRTSEDAPGGSFNPR